MFYRDLITLAALAGLAGADVSCREKEPVVKTDPPPATRPTVAIDALPATPSALITLPAVMRLTPATPDGVPAAYQFPAAKLVLSEKQGVLHAALFSDDPRESIKGTFAGNSFYFDMELNVATRAELEDAIYTFATSSSSDLGDSSNGLFLDGGTRVLQPLRMRVRFGSDGGQTVVLLDGEFADMSEADQVPKPRVNVLARLLPVVVTK